MAENTGRDYINQEGTLKIYLPDGHLADGGLRDIWKATRLPYPKPGKHPIFVESKELHKEYGFPKNHVDRLVLVCRRPHNIPDSVKNFGGLGVSGEDFIRDRLGVPIDENLEYMQRLGVLEVMDLGCRPATILAAFPRDDDVYDAEEVKGFIERVAEIRRGKVRVASEFPVITRYALVEMFGVPEAMFETIKTDGKTEGYPSSGDSELIIDVAESGGQLLENGLRAVRPEIIRPTTPRVIVRTDIYTAHEPVVKELENRLQRGIRSYKRTNSEAFRDKLSEEVFA
ncbi:MAG: hypothetical protein FJY76_01750 [Candidatus Aenigmarchaeota archaeon]|nr:hypothetical protein [Candidatus Aenigmarchaeota archaeon]